MKCLVQSVPYLSLWSRDMDVASDSRVSEWVSESSLTSPSTHYWSFQRRTEAFEMWIRWRMEKNSWLDKVVDEGAVGIMNEDKQILNSVWKKNTDGLAMYWDKMDFCMKLLKEEWELNQQEGGERFKWYMVWQIMTAVLHSNGRQRSEKDGGHREWMSKLLYSRGLLMDRFDHIVFLLLRTFLGSTL